MIWSADSIAEMARGDAAALPGSTSSESTRPRYCWILTCPSITPFSVSAANVRCSLHTGTTDPEALRRPSALTRACSKPPSISESAARMRFPREWPATSAPSKRYANICFQIDSSGVSASRHFRMSPGGGMSRPGTSLPLEPPSSETETIASTLPAYVRTALRVLESPCPPPMATTYGPSESMASSCKSA